MRLARRRAGTGLLFGILLLVTGCAGVPGTAVPAEIAPPDATESITQSLLDFAESGAVRYQGSMSSASDDKVTFDLTSAQTGEVFGTFTLDGKAGTVLVVNKTIYLKAPADFWATLSGLPNGKGKGAALADRWVKVPAAFLGVEFADVFTPDVLGQHLGKGVEQAGKRPLADGETVDVGAVKAVKVETGGGSVYVTERAPHGVVKVELDRVGSSDTTAVSDFTATVTDGSPDVAKFYQDLAGQAGQLTAPIDVLTTVQDGTHEFGECGTASCSITVRFTNTSKIAVTVSVRGHWLGDNAPLGICDAQAGPVAPGQPGSATCTLASPEWIAFYKRANSVPGNHPYSVEWSTLVITDAPDLTALKARAAATPADPKARETDGDHFVYSINYSDDDHEPRVWKYGAVPSKFWRDHGRAQLGTCLSTTGSLCRVDLVTATKDAAAAHGLVRQLTDTYKTDAGECPSAQWVNCKR
ncbi:MAG: hypothetical protein M3443_15000 [Actinomycetota bacterium]|nr:hypothetical protein [Actinomycetota bacterium]